MATGDQAQRKRAKRSGRERGCWTYIGADALETAGIDPHGEAPFYRVWAGKAEPGRWGRVVVNFYPEP
jgi:hypothetical protein